MSAWGGTALYDVVLDGLNRLSRHPGRRSMLLFSDGDDQSSHATLEAAIARAEGSDATIYVIGQGRAIRAHELQTVLKRFSTISGGQRVLHRGRQPPRQVLRGDPRGPQQPVL